MKNATPNAQGLSGAFGLATVLFMALTIGSPARGADIQGYDLTPTAIDTIPLGGSFYDVVVHWEFRDAHEVTTGDTVYAVLRLRIAEMGIDFDTLLEAFNVPPIQFPQCKDMDPGPDALCEGDCPDKMIGEVGCGGLQTGWCFQAYHPGDEEWFCFCVYLWTTTFSAVTIPPGSVVTATIDPGDEVEEFDEANNSFMLGGVVIPTLTEWGMIIFVVLLIGWMSLLLVRRHRGASLRM